MKQLLLLAILAGCSFTAGYLLRKTDNPSGHYQLYLQEDKYVLKDGERIVWVGSFEDNSQIDSIVINDNL